VRKFLALLLVVMLALIPAGSALAATSDTVTITMTGGTLSISTGSPTYDFGTVVQNASYSTATDQFTLTNDGTVQADIDIHGADATGGSPSWQLQADPGADIYALDFSRDLSPSWTEFTTTDVDYIDDLDASSSDSFGLQLWTPVTITDTTNQQSAVITLTASHSLAAGPG
jgi:hypothetical protein